MKAIFPSPRKIPKAPILASLLVAACAQGRITKVTPVTEVASFSAPRDRGWELADSLWLSRRDAQKAWASLVAYRRAAEQQPEVARLWTDYSHACYFLATYTEQNQRWSNPDRSKGLYLEGARAAEAALYLHAEYRRKLAEGADEAAAARALGGEWMESAFWLAANRGHWALGEGRRARTDGRDRFGALMRRIAARDPALYHGGPDRFLGVMFIAAPSPRADSASAHFDRAQAAGPLFFANRTLRAQYLSVFEKDSASFRALLEEVLRLPADTLPGAAVENEFEQARARDLLSRQAELFP